MAAFWRLLRRSLRVILSAGQVPVLRERQRLWLFGGSLLRASACGCSRSGFRYATRSWLFWFAIVPAVMAVFYILLPRESNSFLEVLAASVTMSMVLRFGILLDKIAHSRSRRCSGALREEESD